MTTILVATLFLQIPYNLVCSLNDEIESTEGHYLTEPVDSVYIGQNLYVVDAAQKRIFLLNKEGELKTFGVPGSAPYEFANNPEYIKVDKGNILISEWNYLKTLTFDLDGKFLRSKKRGRFFGEAHELGLKWLTWIESFKSGYTYKDLSLNCLFSKLNPEPDAGYHLSWSHIFRGEDESIVVVKKSGTVEVFEDPCKLISECPVPIEQFKGSLKPSRLLTQLNRINNPESKVKGFFHGVPILHAAVKNKNQIWLLIKDENKENPPYYQVNVSEKSWLLELDPIKRNVTFLVQLPFPASRIRYTENHLILISKFESIVQVFKVK